MTKKIDLGTCQAETYVEGTGYNLIRYIRTWNSKPCDKKAKVKLGELCVCGTHERLAREGFIGQKGQGVDPGQRADYRRNRHVTSGPFGRWVDQLEAEVNTPTR